VLRGGRCRIRKAAELRAGLVGLGLTSESGQPVVEPLVVADDGLVQAVVVSTLLSVELTTSGGLVQAAQLSDSAAASVEQAHEVDGIHENTAP
jgi:hypothetical protein